MIKIAKFYMLTDKVLVGQWIVCPVINLFSSFSQHQNERTT